MPLLSQINCLDFQRTFGAPRGFAPDDSRFGVTDDHDSQELETFQAVLDFGNIGVGIAPVLTEEVLGGHRLESR